MLTTLDALFGHGRKVVFSLVFRTPKPVSIGDNFFHLYFSFYFLIEPNFKFARYAFHFTGEEIKVDLAEEGIKKKGTKPMRYIVKDPVKAVKIAKTLITDWNKEHFIGLYLSPRLRVEKAELISLGCLDACLVHPRETFRPALINSTVRVIVLHNHPSGDVEPSEDDLTITKRLVEAGKILGIDLYDHIVFTKKNWLSMKDKKII